MRIERCVVFRVEMAEGVANLADIVHRGIDGLGGDAEGNEDSGNGGVDSGIEEEEPDYGAQEDIEGLALDEAAASEIEDSENEGGPGEEFKLDSTAIEYGDYDDATDIVNDGQSGQEDLQGDGHTLAEHCEHSEGEGNVCGHGDCGAAAIVRAMGKEEEDDYGNCHAADGSDDGEQGLAKRREFANENFPFDFQADTEEEDGHQRIIDELDEGHWFAMMAEEIEGANLEAHLLFPEL